MVFDFGGWGVSLDVVCEDKIFEGVEFCFFLCNIGVIISFVFFKLKFFVLVFVSFFLIIFFWFWVFFKLL